MWISAIQMDVRTRDVAGNMERAYRHVQEAVRRGSDLVLLPEMWSTGFAYPDMVEVAQESFQATSRFMAETAREGKVWLVGSVAEPADGGVYNTLFWYSPAGEVAGTYRKAHLFAPTHEDQHFLAGDRVAVVPTQLGLTGGLICFDIRFPEIARKLVIDGATILLVAAQFPHPRSSHWETLLRARAIENQVWVVAANRIGSSGGLDYFGQSMIIDPWGEIVAAEMAEREAVVTERIQVDAVDRVRRELPCRRRADIYGELAPGSGHEPVG